MSLKLPQAPANYDRNDQAQMRGAIERADQQDRKTNADVDLRNGTRLVFYDENGTAQFFTGAILGDLVRSDITPQGLTLTEQANARANIGAGTGSGSTTSVGLTMPAIFGVSGSPVTTAGTLAVSLNSQSANLVFAGPSSGSPAAPTFRALAAADMPAIPSGTSPPASPGIGLWWDSSLGSGRLKFWYPDANSSQWVDATPVASGTATSVGLSAPSIFTVSGSPVSTSGTLTFTLNTQSANTLFAGPTSGGAATPTFRAMVTADIPNAAVTYAKIQNVSANSVLLGAGASGSGAAPVEITLGTNLSMSGTTLNAAGGGGGGGGAAPTYRGSTTSGAITGTSATLTLPAGSVAGDFLVFGGAGGFAAYPTSAGGIYPSSSGGWTPYPGHLGNWTNYVFTRTLTSGDISTGSIAVTVQGSFVSYAFISVFAAGAYLAALGQDPMVMGSTSVSQRQSLSAMVPQVGSVGINSNVFWLEFASGRGASGTFTITPGTLVGSAMTNANGSAVLYTNSSFSGLPIAAANHGNITYNNLGHIIIGF